MFQTICNISLILLFISLSSCSTQYYLPPEQGALATVSLSTLSSDIPEINIISNCKLSTFNHYLIERRKPTDKSINLINIPSNKEITFQNNYYLISSQKTKFNSKSGFSPHIDTMPIKELSLCTQSVTFIPEENKHYEVYFGISDGKCTINAEEGQRIQDATKKRLMRIEYIKDQQC